MPNTPAAVGRGASAGFASPATSARQRQWAQSLMSAVGQFDWLADEALIDAVTAISGSGPAYVFALVEAMAEAGVKLGLPAELAMKLARATVEGAGELLHREPAVTAAKLRENVTSPGGTTAAALGDVARARRLSGAARQGRRSGARPGAGTGGIARLPLPAADRRGGRGDDAPLPLASRPSPPSPRAREGALAETAEAPLKSLRRSAPRAAGSAPTVSRALWRRRLGRRRALPRGR